MPPSDNIKEDDVFSIQSFTENIWSVVEYYFRENGLVKHQIDSFNDFILRKMEETIEGFNPIEVYHQYIPETDKFRYILKINITNPVLSKPIIYEKDGSTKIMTPNDARLRNFTYASPLNVDIEITAQTFDDEIGDYVNDIKKINNINIAKIPIMIGSRYCILNSNPDIHHVNECKRDMGGYFIINGNEKVVVSQDRICENKTFVFTNRTSLTQYSHIAEIRSVAENKFGVPKTTTLKLSSKSNQFGRYIRVNIHHIKYDIPLFILFKALGIESDKDILRYIVYDTDDVSVQIILKELVGTIDEANDIVCARDALEYMSKYLHINGYPKEMVNNRYERLNIIRTILEKEFLPHVGTDFKKKALYLGYMVNKLIHCYLGLWEMDDRDSYINKRVDSPGVLMANLFRQYFGKMIKDMKNMLQKEINTGSWKATGKFSNVINKVNVYKIIKSTVIESGLKYALATGNWGIKNNKNKQGVAQVLNRMTYNATLSHLRRVNTPLEKTGKLVQPRKLHSTQFGYICPAETPEGASVGLVKNLTMMSNITIASNSINVRTILDEMGIIRYDGGNIEIFHNETKVIVNGDIIGIHEKPQELFATLKELKRNGAINIYTGVVWNIHKNEININTEGGRCVRPLFVVDDNEELKLKPSILRNNDKWRDLVLEGCVEYLDVEESNTSMIAMRYGDLFKKDKGGNKRPLYRHLEVHPSLILGVLAGSIPFSNHNQAPRNCYQCLATNETVLMANGEKKEIKDVRIGDEVITFDPKTMYPTITKVTHQYVRPTENKIYEVETISGRKIVATGNHNFMTTEGWKKVEDFDTNTKIGVFMNPEPVSMEVEDYLILDENGFKDKLNAIGIKQSLIEKHAKQLSTMGILPLRSIDKNIPIIARFAGVALTDGSLNIYNKKHGGWTGQFQGSFGSKFDASLFEDDVASLGMQKVNILEQNREVFESSFHTWKVSHNGILPSLLLALDISYGNKKTIPRKPLPMWIVNGSKLVKREFLSSFLGGDGNKLFATSTGNMSCAMVYQTVRNDNIPALKVFMEQIAELISSFDVEVTWVKEKSAKYRGTNDKREDAGRVAFQVSVYQENLKKQFENIGYRYSYHKTIESAMAVEYYKYKQHCQNHHIVKMLYSDWINTLEANGTSLFVPIKSITEVENQLISDITVEHDNHSFIAGENFLSSNSAMGKQAIGIYASNFRHRFDTMSHILNYPQKPIVETNISKLVYTGEMPCGVNVIVAIACMTGFNQEDSIIMNKSAVDRGLFSSTFYRTYREQNNKNHSNGEEEIFVKPNVKNTKGIKPFNYEKLNEDGFIPENTFVDSNDIIIGKVMPQKVENSITYKDTSISLKNNETGFIDRNCYGDKYFTNINGDGYNFAKVRIRNMRVPTIGDKFSCYTADHDVLTMKGWVAIDKLTTEHEVATLVGDALVYQKPQEVQQYDFDGNMYKIKSNQVDLFVTPNHRMYVSTIYTKGIYKMTTAEEIYNKRRHYKKNANIWIPNFANIPKEFVFTDGKLRNFKVDDDTIVPINEWIKFMGIWFAEGSCCGNSYVGFASHKQRVKDALNELNDILGFNMVHRKERANDTEYNNYRVYDKSVINFFVKYNVGSVNKYLPEWVWCLPREQCQVLIDGMMLGDGHWMKNGTRRYDSSSIILRDDFQRLCLHAGYSANAYLKYNAGKVSVKKDGSVIKSTADAWRLTINTTQNQPKVNKNYPCDEWVKYKGKVYCCTVPQGLGVIYVRRNGIPVWSGNSRHGQDYRP